MSKKMKIFALAALAVSLMAGMASATDYTWTGGAKLVSLDMWENPLNWSATSPDFPRTSVDVAVFTQSATPKISISQNVELKRIAVSADKVVVIEITKDKNINFASAASLDVESKGKLQIMGQGYVKFTGPTQLDPKANASIILSTVIETEKTAGVPVVSDDLPKGSLVAFERMVNPAGTTKGTGNKAWPADVKIPVGEGAVLSVNNTSQMTAHNAIVSVDLKGTLRVTGTVEVTGSQTCVEIDGVYNNWPKFDVWKGATFKAQGAVNPVLWTKVASKDIKFSKLGEGFMTLIGANGKNQAPAVSSDIAQVIVDGGTLAFKKGSEIPAFIASNDDVVFTVNSGHLSFENSEAVRPKSKPAKFFLDIKGGMASVARQSISSPDASVSGDQYPVLASAVEVRFPFDVRANVAKGAALNVNGDQAFKQVKGAGDINIAKDANLILTEQGANWDLDIFTGPVSGDGGVAFAGLLDQVYPFTGKNTYTGDTLVYGKPGRLVLCENSNLGESTLYLRSVKPGKNSADPSDKVGSLHIVRVAGPSKNVNNVSLAKLKIDGANSDALVATVDIDGPGAESSEDYLKTNQYPHLLVVDETLFHVNKPEFASAQYVNVLSLIKKGEGTLLLNGTGTGGDTSVEAGVDVQKGMLWLYKPNAIGSNQIRVAPDATLRAANGTVLPANVRFEQPTSKFITEVNAKNLNNDKDAYAVRINGDILGDGINFAKMLVWDTENPFRAGYGYHVLWNESKLADTFNAQTETQKGGHGAPFLTGWLEKPGDGLMFGTQRDVAVPVLSEMTIISPFKPGKYFEGVIKVLHVKDQAPHLGQPRVDLLVGGMSSLGATLMADNETIHVRGNVSPETTKAILTVHLNFKDASMDKDAPERSLPAERTYDLFAGEVPPGPKPPVTTDLTATLTPSAATVKPGADVTVTVGDWMYKGAKVEVISEDVTVTNGTIKTPLAGGKVVLTAGTKGTMDITVTAKLKSDPKIDGKAVYSVKVDDGSTPPTPGGKSSSGGGCDAGFAGLALLLAAPLFLRKKD